MRFIFSAILIFCTSDSFSQLHVVVDNLKKDTGTVLIALYNSKNTFGKIREVFREGRAKVKDLKADYTFSDLPPGEYAISLFHDVNDNEALDKSSLGFPSEPYGFSNNALGSFGPPPFKKVKFYFSGDPKEMAIKVN
jgi:uncharacterized protein (DUF2141 family)